MGTAGEGNHFLHNRVSGTGFFEVVINKADGIIAFTELSAGTGMMLSEEASPQQNPKEVYPIKKYKEYG
jgi:hypothetical protein